MAYSLDLKTKIIDYIENGDSVTEAAKIFQVRRASIYRWLNRETLESTKVKRRSRKLDWLALKSDLLQDA